MLDPFGSSILKHGSLVKELIIILILYNKASTKVPELFQYPELRKM